METVIKDNTGTKYLNEDGELHRPTELGPAFIRANGTQEYYENGKCHRPFSEGPAIICYNGTEKYYHRGELHRPHEDGPAVTNKLNGRTLSQIYYKNGKKHRPYEEGPAIINHEHNYIVYYHEGKEHRPTEHGPAYMKQVTLFDKLVNNSPVYKQVELSVSYMENGKLHRPYESGPAMILKVPYSTYYTKTYYCRGKIHRQVLDGWAHLIHLNGKYTREYYENGKRIENPIQYKKTLISVIKIQTFWKNYINKKRLIKIE